MPPVSPRPTITTDTRSSSLAGLFARLTREWKQARRGRSTVKAMVELEPYQQIIKLGEPAVPYILAELEREEDHWFVALKAITGADPVPSRHRGRIPEMTKAWLRWGKVHGHGPRA